MNFNLFQNVIKPSADLLSAFVLLLILSPLLLLTILILLFSNKGSVFFIQERPGFKAKPFKIIKFKTMRDAFDEFGNPLADELRLSKMGKFIRSTSIDELLQLINVLKGDMSIVGPRPLLMKYLDRYTPDQARRHDVKPGITGWAQVNGRNAISWEEKFSLDIFYVENHSFLFDIKIIYLTVLNVLQRKGISGENQATMEEFKGVDS